MPFKFTVLKKKIKFKDVSLYDLRITSADNVIGIKVVIKHPIFVELFISVPILQKRIRWPDAFIYSFRSLVIRLYSFFVKKCRSGLRNKRF